MPRRRRFKPHPHIQHKTLVDFEVVLEEERRVGGPIVFVFSRSLVEGSDSAQEEISHRIAGDVAIEDEVAGPAELIRNIHSIARYLSAELQAVAPQDYARPVAPLEPVPHKRRFEVVADLKEARDRDLLNGRQGRIQRQPHAQVFHARHARRRAAPRVNAVVAEVEFVQHRRAEGPRPGERRILRSHARLVTPASVREQVIVIEDRGVPEMVNKVTSAQTILDSQLVINLRDALIQLLRDVAGEYDLAGSPHSGYELQYVYRRRVKPVYRNLVVWKAGGLDCGVAGSGQQRIL